MSIQRLSRPLVILLTIALTCTPAAGRQSSRFTSDSEERIIAFAKQRDRAAAREEKAAEKEFRKVFQERGTERSQAKFQGTDLLLPLQSMTDAYYSGVKRERQFLKRLMDLRKEPSSGMGGLLSVPLSRANVSEMARDARNLEQRVRTLEAETAGRYLSAVRGAAAGRDRSLLEAELRVISKRKVHIESQLQTFDFVLREMGAPSSAELYAQHVQQQQEMKRRAEARETRRPVDV